MGFLSKLQDRWELKNITQVIIILIVFACTGFTVMFLKKPIMNLIVNTGDDIKWFYTVLYYVFILPIYFAVLLFYGFIFGQFSFFKSFVMKTIHRIMGRRKDANDAK